MKKTIFKAFVMAFLFLFSFANSALQAQDVETKEYIIGGINVSGVQFLDPIAVANLSGLKGGDKLVIPSTDLGNAIKKLWKTGLFGHIDILIERIEGEKIFLNITLQERPKISRLEFIGVKKGSRTSLAEKLGGVRGSIITDAITKNMKLGVKKFYAEKGFNNADVNVVQTRDSLLQNAVILKVKIKKNSKVKVRDILVEGNTAITDKKIQRTMKIKKKSWKRIFNNAKFIAKKFEEDKDKIIELYNTKGYRDARIVSDCVYAVSPKRVMVKMSVEEGKKHYFRNIYWEGNYKYTDEQLAKYLGIQKGDVYDRALLDKKISLSMTDIDISSLYMDDGYLFFRINPIESVIDGDSVDIKMQIYEGQQANINSVIINGNTKTSDHVVLREIRTIPGQKFSRRQIIRTNQALGALGFFDAEKIQINPIPHPESGTVDVEYKLVEKPSDQLELSGGWGGFQGFVGTLGVSFNNFSLRKAGKLRNWRPVPTGDGQRLSVRAQANGRAFQSYSLSFTEPWLGGKKPNSLTVSLSHSIQNRGIGAPASQQGKLQMSSITFNLGRRLKFPDDYFVLSNALTYQRISLRNSPISGSLFDTGVANTITFGTTLSRSSIANPTFPREGSSFTLSGTLTPPFSLLAGQKSKQEYDKMAQADKFNLIEYYKIMLDASMFAPVFGKLVFHSRFHFGSLNAYNKNLGVGPFERFQMGGSGLTNQNMLIGVDLIGLRGYADNVIVPQDPSNRSGSPTLGTLYNKYVMELRYPISLNPAATIFVLGFAEGGNTYLNFETFNPFKVYRSVGVGARIFMPAFGMIGIDWGQALDNVPGRSDGGKQNFTFTIGQQLR